MTGKWACGQIGAREHYAIPRALQRRGLLDTLYTDAWVGPVMRRLAGSSFKRLAGRWHPEVPDDRVMEFTATAVVDRVRNAFIRPTGVTEESREYLRVGKAFGHRVAAALAGRASLPSSFFSYTTGALEPLRLLAERGVPTLVGQIDPGRVEEELIQAEHEKWPGWEPSAGRVAEEYYARLAAEWETADLVVVNSEWSRAGLMAQGVPADRLVVLPLAYDPPGPPPERRPQMGPFTILWLGQVSLRKGIPYLLEAVRRLGSASIRVVVAGPIRISESAVRTAPANVRFIGPVARADAVALYRSADAFVLPTLSDGFAITQLEAMSQGLPVVITPNCGRVVTDGVDGRVVSAADPDELASALESLATDPANASEMGRRAAQTAAKYSIDALADRLVVLASEHFGSKSS